MEFSENPEIFISQYFDDKINQIDSNCEVALLSCESDYKREIFNKARLNLINQIKSAREEVLNRFNLTESSYGVEMQRYNEDEIQDKIFLDNYCYVWNINRHKLIQPLLAEFKIGIVIFSEYKDDILEKIRF